MLLPRPAHADERLSARLQAARELAARHPRQAIRELQSLRRDAMAVDALSIRLGADEIECRALTDLDQAEALRVADAGVSAAGGDPPAAARLGWLRLRACRAGVLLDRGEAERGTAELDDILARTPSTADTAARAMALLERGLYRSRKGDLLPGQDDLITACRLLRSAGTVADQDLCTFHLSSHYRRMGDLDEALKLLNTLHERAQRSGALYDDSIYLYSMAFALQMKGQWPQALARYRDALVLNEQFEDAHGIAFAEHGMARSLVELKRPQDAIAHARRALQMVDWSEDPREHSVRTITLAEALTAAGKPGEARQLLDGLEARVRSAGHASTLARWLVARARALGQLAQWRESQANLLEAREIEHTLHAQQLSEHSARLRMQFNRARDEEEMDALRRLNEQGQRLRETQALALALFVILLVGALIQVGRKMRQTRELKRLAMTDELTGLPNRRAMFEFGNESLSRSAASAAPLSVLMIDVDHFKRINDTHGHAVGDQVLQRLARSLVSVIRDGDRLGRVGGEEFMAVLPGVSSDEAGRIAERMRQAALSESASGRDDEAVRFSVSIGVAGTAGVTALDTLLSRADEALYRAKAGGRNRVCVADAPSAGQPAPTTASTERPLSAAACP